jgi:hypothetical protein
MPKCSGLSSRKEQTPILRVTLQIGLRFHSRGYEQPPHQRACGTTNSRWLAGGHCTSSVTTTSVSGSLTAAAMASGQMLLLKGLRSHPLTGDENQPLKPKSRRPEAQVALTVSPAEATTAAVGSLSSGGRRFSTGDSSRLRTMEDRQLHPGQAATVHLPPHGWRTPLPHSWRMPLSPECWRKKRVTGPHGGRPQLGAPPSPARMINILEAEGGAEAAARLASPHHKAGDHPYG